MKNVKAEQPVWGAPPTFAGAPEEEARRNAISASPVAWSQYGPTLTRKEMRGVTKIKRSKEYELTNPKHLNYDPTFPQGFRAFDSPRAPKIWWTHEIAAHMHGRAQASRNKKAAAK